MPAPPLGVFLPTLTERGEPVADIVATARHIEDLDLESVWVVDQLIAGTGVPILDSGIALAAAAGATSRVKLAYGVMILPLRPVIWAAKQAASLQHVSGGRALLGVGVGGDRHERSWTAAGVPRRERGRRLDAGLEVLPDLIAGREVELDGATVQLSPGAPVPPIVVGGTVDAALARAVRHADSWFALPLPPPLVAATVDRLRELAAEAGRPVPAVTGSMMVAIEGDPSLPDAEGLVRKLSDVDGLYGIPAEAVPDMLVTGDAGAIAVRLAELAGLGAERIVVTLAAGDWFRQAELLAEAAALVD